MKNTELMKKQREFARTPFGRRAKIFSVCPFFVAAVFLGFYFFNYNNENALVPVLYFLGFWISIVGICITQLQYGNMLNDYLKEDN